MIKNTNDEVSFYIDTMIIETLMSHDKNLIKTAQSQNILNSLIDRVKQYVSNQIDPNDKVKSVLNILAPGAISTLLGVLGFGWIGTLLGLAMNIFHVDTVGAFTSIYEKIKNSLTSNGSISSTKIDEIVHNSVHENTGATTQEEADFAEQKLRTQSNLIDLKDAQLLKLAMNEYDIIVLNNLKYAASSGFFSIFSNKKAKTINLLIKVIGWIVKVVIGSAGLLVAGDVVNNFLGRPNAIDNTYQRGVNEGESAPVNIPKSNLSHQTKFKINPSYHEQNDNANAWTLNINNNESSIEQALINMAKEVYQGLENEDANIISSNKFKNIVDTISWYNRSSAGGPIVFIPKIFTSKKNLVDHFIDEVADKTQ